jgi:hypothetical protein
MERRWSRRQSILLEFEEKLAVESKVVAFLQVSLSDQVA